MKITEPARDIDVIHSTDVLVVGSGPGGLAAALAAARTGVEVTLVVRFGCFAAISPWWGSRVVPGITTKKLSRRAVLAGSSRSAKSLGAAVPESQSLSYELDSECFKLVADRLVEEADVHAMLHRQFVAPIMEGDVVKGIITESKAGREAILAQRVIDATGDADIAHRAGARTVKTPLEDVQAASVMFYVAGINK